MEHKVPIQGNYNEIIIHKTGFDELNIKKINKYFYQIWMYMSMGKYSAICTQ